MSGRAIGPLRWLRILKRLVIGGEAEVHLEHGARLYIDGTQLSATADELNRMANPALADADIQKLADLDATAAQVNSLVQFPGLLAYGVLRVAANVADGETVTIGADVYEFDTGDGVTEGNIAVDVSGGVTPADATDALVAAINASSTEAVTAQDISDNQVLVVADAPGAVTLDLDTDMQGADNGWDAEAMHGGEAAGLKRAVRVAHVPNAVELALDRVLIPLGFAPAAAIVQVRVTASGDMLAWSGTTLLRSTEQRVDLINAGDANDFTGDHTITLIAFE